MLGWSSGSESSVMSFVKRNLDDISRLSRQSLNLTSRILPVETCMVQNSASLPRVSYAESSYCACSFARDVELVDRYWSGFFDWFDLFPKLAKAFPKLPKPLPKPPPKPFPKLPKPVLDSKADSPNCLRGGSERSYAVLVAGVESISQAAFAARIF
jgi:hypothetical protein